MASCFGQNNISKLVEKDMRYEIHSLPTDTLILPDTGRIIIHEDQNLGVLIQKYNSTRIDLGFRVQIHSGLNRVDALKSQNEILKLYPDISSYVIYQQPNFKVRVGDFENRLTVGRFYEEMKEVFPSAFIIADEIEVATD